MRCLSCARNMYEFLAHNDILYLLTYLIFIKLYEIAIITPILQIGKLKNQDP